MKLMYTAIALLNISSLAYSQNCEDVFVRNNVNYDDISEHAHFVSECLHQVSEISKSAYKASFKVCENQVRYKDIHDDITLPNGTVLRPSLQVENWEEFALRIGGEANTSGCRDGILSGIINKEYFTKERLLRFFQENEFALDEPFDGLYEYETSTIFGTIYSSVNVTRSDLIGDMEVSRHELEKRGHRVYIKRAKYFTEGYLKGIFKAGPLSLRVDDPYYVSGRVSGYIDIRNQSVHFETVEVDQFDLKDGSLSQWGMEQVNIFANGNYFRENLSEYWEEQFREAYRSIDPFLFLKNN